MKISAQHLRSMGVDIPAEIPDCAETEMPNVYIPPPTFDTETKTAKFTTDVTFEFTFISPFEWIEVSFFHKISVSRNKREGWFIGLSKFYSGSDVKIRYRQGLNLKHFTPLRKLKKTMRLMEAQGY